jgi:hypothetical protein
MARMKDKKRADFKKSARSVLMGINWPFYG